MKKRPTTTTVTIDIKLTQPGESDRKPKWSLKRIAVLGLLLVVVLITATACYIAAATQSVEPLQEISEFIKSLLEIVSQAVL